MAHWSRAMAQRDCFVCVDHEKVRPGAPSLRPAVRLIETGHLAHPHDRRDEA